MMPALHVESGGRPVLGTGVAHSHSQGRPALLEVAVVVQLQQASVGIQVHAVLSARACPWRLLVADVKGAQVNPRC